MADDTVLAVCCYGHVDAGRNPGEFAGYQKYLDGVCNLIHETHSQDRLRKVILCGGHTNPALPESEAESAQRYLEAQLGRLGHKITFRLEKESRNSVQNIAGALEILGDFGGKLVIVCDRARAFRIRVIAWRLCRKTTLRQWHVVAISRPDTSWKSNRLIQGIKAVGYLICPWLINRELGKTRRRFRPRPRPRPPRPPRGDSMYS